MPIRLAAPPRRASDFRRMQVVLALGFGWVGMLAATGIANAAPSGGQASGSQRNASIGLDDSVGDPLDETPSSRPQVAERLLYEPEPLADAARREASVQLRTSLIACRDEQKAPGGDAALPGPACTAVAELMRDVAVAIESNRAGPLAEPACAVRVDSAICSLRAAIADDARCVVALAEGGTCTSSEGVGRGLDDAGEGIIHRFNSYFSYRQGDVSVVLRGGLSLGNYQAGVAYYISEYMKARHEQRERLAGSHAGTYVPSRGFASVTGASAGGINTFISALEPWKATQANPEQTDYFIGWTAVGLFGRHGAPGFVPEGSKSDSSLGLLSKEPLKQAAERVAGEAEDGIGYAGVEGSTGMGITVTRLEAFDAPIHYIAGAQDDAGDGPPEHVGLTANKQSERLLFNVESSHSAGKATMTVGSRRPYLSPERLETEGSEYANVRSLYPVLGSGYGDAAAVENARYDFKEIVPVLQATSAFPLAFTPVSLTYTPVTHDGEPAASETRDFVDGGVFDNTPLGLAIEMDDWQQRRRAAAPAAGRCDVHGGASALFEQILCAYAREGQYTYFFVEPTVTDWKPGSGVEGADTTPKTNDGNDDRPLLKTELDFVLTFAGTSNGAALLSTSEDQPFVVEDGNWLQRRRRLVIPERRMSITAAQLANFMAFFERDFRVVDFYIGIMDAEYFVADDPVFAMLETSPKITSPRYSCIRDYYTTLRNDRSGAIEISDMPGSCAIDRLMRPKNVEVLAKVENLKRLERQTIRRIDEDWAQTEPDAHVRALLEAAEDRISAKNFRGLLVALHNYRVWTLSPDYDEDEEFERFFAELDAVRYAFVDMQQGRRLESLSLSAEQARLLIRDLMQRGVNQLSKAQPDRGQRVAVSLLGTLGADFYEARPSLWQYSLGLNFNGLESSTGFYIGHHRRVRWDFVGARLYRLRNELYAIHENIDDDSIKRTSASGLVYSRLAVVAIRKAILGLEIGAGVFADWMFTFKPRPGPGNATKRNFIGMRYGPEVSLTAVLLRHIYVDLQLGIYADDCQRRASAERCQVDPAYFPRDGRRPNLTLTSPVRFSAGLGWRWTF